MIIRCPDGVLINMDWVVSVKASAHVVAFEIRAQGGNIYLPCESEEQAREIVDLIFQARVSRLDLGGSLESASEKMTPGGSGRE